MTTSSPRPGPRRGRPSPPPASADPAAFSRALDEAAAHFRAGRLDAAAQVYRRLERQAPGDVRAAYSLAVIDIRQDRLDRARRRLEAVVVTEPALAAAHHNLAAVRQRLGDWPGAAKAYDQALALRPQAAETRLGLAAALAALGRADEAIAQHRILARELEWRWAALTRIALIDPAAIDDGEFAAMQDALAADGLDADVRTGLWFAVGDILDRRDRDSEAFEAYAAGNRLKHAALGPAVAEAAAANAAAARHVRELMTPQFLASHAGQGDPTTAPIFVVGMPRSGSTLVEQILASHSVVQGLGETGVLPTLAAQGYPRTSAGLRDLAARYLTALRQKGWDGASRVVDKTLENYLHVGLISLLFPRATILHAVRNPMATGFACYRQLFTSGNESLYDLAEIGAEYRRYRSLMEHWDAVLPGRIRDVAYEGLVVHPEDQIRSLATDAGLSWEPELLDFHRREGAVQTASASQVRRPIYASAVERWRRHAARLAPLAEALGSYAAD